MTTTPILQTVTVTVNGQQYTREVPTYRTLVDFIRYDLGLTGTKETCSVGVCGACTIEMDGKITASCITLAVRADGADIRTIEGVADGEKLHPIQEGFNVEHGLQCGFCTPGMIMTTWQLLERNSNPDEAEIRHALEGNYCRCTGYENIVKSIQYAAEKSA